MIKVKLKKDEEVFLKEFCKEFIEKEYFHDNSLFLSFPININLMILKELENIFINKYMYNKDEKIIKVYKIIYKKCYPIHIRIKNDNKHISKCIEYFINLLDYFNLVKVI